MLITGVAFTGTARMRDHWSVCTQYIVEPLIVVCVQRFLVCPQWYQQRQLFQRRGLLLFPQRFHTPADSCSPEEDIQTREVGRPGWPGHRATTADPSIPEGRSQMIPHSNAEMNWRPIVLEVHPLSNIHRHILQEFWQHICHEVSHFSMRKLLRLSLLLTQGGNDCD